MMATPLPLSELTLTPSPIEVYVGVSWMKPSKIIKVKIGLYQQVFDLREAIAKASGLQMGAIILHSASNDNLVDCATLKQLEIGHGDLVFAKLDKNLGKLDESKFVLYVKTHTGKTISDYI